MNDPYSVLGVSRSASLDEIKKAYKKLAMKHHPDKGGDESKFKSINEAYNYIKNPPEEEPQAHYQNNPWTGFEDVFAQHFGGQNPFNNHRREYQQPRNQDIRITMYVTLEEVVNCAEKNIDVRYNNTSKSVTVHIPKGIGDGTEVRYAGYGSDMYPGQPGNLYVVFKFKKHNEFNVEEHDLVKKVNISIRDAMLGADTVIHTLDGRTLRLNIKPGTQSKTRLRIPEGGLPRRNLPNGNLYIELNVQIPKLDSSDLEKPLKDVL